MFISILFILNYVQFEFASCFADNVLLRSYIYDEQDTSCVCLHGECSSWTNRNAEPFSSNSVKWECANFPYKLSSVLAEKSGMRQRISLEASKAAD